MLPLDEWGALKQMFYGEIKTIPELQTNTPAYNFSLF